MLERLLGLENCVLISRVGKGNASHKIAIRGEDYLRIIPRDPIELMGNIIIEYQEILVLELRNKFYERIQKQT